VKNAEEHYSLLALITSIMWLENLTEKNIDLIKNELGYYASDVILLRPIEASGTVLITMHRSLQMLF